MQHGHGPAQTPSPRAFALLSALESRCAVHTQCDARWIHASQCTQKQTTQQQAGELHRCKHFGSELHIQQICHGRRQQPRQQQSDHPGQQRHEAGFCDELRGKPQWAGPQAFTNGNLALAPQSTHTAEVHVVDGGQAQHGNRHHAQRAVQYQTGLLPSAVKRYAGQADGAHKRGLAPIRAQLRRAFSCTRAVVKNVLQLGRQLRRGGALGHAIIDAPAQHVPMTQYRCHAAGW